ncbi:hypothetical protein BSA145_21395 (plasmid) [Bacillus safensis]|uniref:Uncharacterized protein n=1 Tax=Bacillus safensis TaxID=561879 RepID=A0A1L6ZPJ8_BACIA|nr:hypothetical protein BSA145_21395 [Bacillus safensis]
MAGSGLRGRLRRLEDRVGGSAWRAWQGRPFSVWPDAALLAFIYDSAGLPVPPVPPSDEEIAMVAGLPEAAA